MTCKFNSGRGAHICDRCRVMICDGMIPKPEYRYSKVANASQHWLLPKTQEVPESMREDYVSSYHDDSPWEHHCEFCPECAVIVEIDNDVKLVTAKELYGL